MSDHENFSQFFDNVKDSELYEVERLKIKFANDLYAILQTHDISNTEFAEKIDSSVSYITKVLRGDANFTISTMVKLARAVNCKMTLELCHKEENNFNMKEYIKSFMLKRMHKDISDNAVFELMASESGNVNWLGKSAHGREITIKYQKNSKVESNAIA